MTDRDVETIAAAGYEDRHEGLHVCRDCARLWENETGGRERPPAQQCTCSGPPDKWEGWDVSEWARLCDCCTGEVLQSGTRWSPFFCDECRSRVRALNSRLGMALIPIGRHSLMNGVTLDPDAGDAAIEVFSGTMLGLFDRMTQLGEWKEQRIAGVLDALGLDDGVLLVDYLLAVHSSDDPFIDKRSAFTQLAAFFGVTLAES